MSHLYRVLGAQCTVLGAQCTVLCSHVVILTERRLNSYVYLIFVVPCILLCSENNSNEMCAIN